MYLSEYSHLELWINLETKKKKKNKQTKKKKLVDYLSLHELKLFFFLCR